MSIKGNLNIAFIDSRRRFINRAVKVELKRGSSLVQEHTTAATAPNLILNDLEAAPNDTFQISCYADDYHPVSQVTLLDPGATKLIEVRFPIKADAQVKMGQLAYAALPEKLRDLLQASKISPQLNQPLLSGQALFEALSNEQKAGLLNLFAKMQHTTTASGQSVISKVLSLNKILPARLYIHAEAGLYDVVKDASNFGVVSNKAHNPPPGYERRKSFKTPDRYGNLQLTFFHNPVTSDWLIDADIDDARGIGHLFQVLRNHRKKTDTHPYDIQQILLVAQDIDPGYDLIV